MNPVSTRIITGDVARLVASYERVTGVAAAWANDDFAEIITPHSSLAVASERTVPLFSPGSARPATNDSAIIEFLVDDVDRLHRELADSVTDWVNGPTTMPWGNLPLLFRDPDGNLVNFFEPVTPAAVERFAGR
ncbi:VOC family protein [Streptomyces werraensis]|uniref:VOC family protein n=1 Tax=Streptomyces werraensis TaxID=68284 RepID=UPI001CE283FD